MKVLFIGGGGSGGHFYPIIAVARALKKLAQEEHIISLELFFAAENAFDAHVLAEENIKFISVPAGKIPRYVSLAYLTTPFKVALGVVVACIKLYQLLPDIIFSKGGYSAFPMLVAARILRIPVIVHETDSIPGLVNRWAGKWANVVALSFPGTLEFFKKNPHIILTGNPIRTQIVGGNIQEAIETFSLEENIPVILVLGGSQGAEIINEMMLGLIGDAVRTYQIIHQTGVKNFEDVSGRARVILEKNEHQHRYHPYGFLSEGDLRDASRIASCIVSRAGGSIFEIAAWGKPSILVPLSSAAQDHQRENAYAYARSGASEIIEETNLKPHIMLAAIDKILGDPEKIKTMERRAGEFAKLDAAERIAHEIITLGVHE